MLARSKSSKEGRCAGDAILSRSSPKEVKDNGYQIDVPGENKAKEVTLKG